MNMSVSGPMNVLDLDSSKDLQDICNQSMDANLGFTSEDTYTWHVNKDNLGFQSLHGGHSNSNSFSPPLPILPYSPSVRLNHDSQNSSSKTTAAFPSHGLGPLLENSGAWKAISPTALGQEDTHDTPFHTWFHSICFTPKASLLQIFRGDGTHVAKVVVSREVMTAEKRCMTLYQLSRSADKSFGLYQITRMKILNAFMDIENFASILYSLHIKKNKPKGFAVHMNLATRILLRSCFCLYVQAETEHLEKAIKHLIRSKSDNKGQITYVKTVVDALAAVYEEASADSRTHCAGHNKGSPTHLDMDEKSLQDLQIVSDKAQQRLQQAAIPETTLWPLSTDVQQYLTNLKVENENRLNVLSSITKFTSILCIVLQQQQQQQQQMSPHVKGQIHLAIWIWWESYHYCQAIKNETEFLDQDCQAIKNETEFLDQAIKRLICFQNSSDEEQKKYAKKVFEALGYVCGKYQESLSNP